jgi:hypothetical protein
MRLEAFRACGFIAAMTEAALRAALNEFLKNVGVTAQREMEKALRTALASGKLHGGEVLTMGVTLSNPKVGLDVSIFKRLEL